MPRIIRKIIRIVLAILIVGFAVPLNTVTAWAVLPRETLRTYGLNNTYYYDPYACNEGNSGTTFCTPVSGENITWIGDSYSTGAKEIIESEFPGISFGGTVNTDQSTIQDCKFVGVDTDCLANPTNPSGLKVLQNVIAAGNLKPYLVFALGTNGGWSSSDVTEFNRIMAGQPNTRVVLVTSKTPGEDFASSNELLKKMAEDNANYSLADWTMVYKESYFGGDAEHPYDDGGFNEWVRIIKEAMPQNCTAGLLPGDSIAEKIWNYFVQANIEGVSDNPAAIAGILGNLYTESGLNPFMNGSDGDYYRGLYMLNSDNGSALWSAITSAVGNDYWKFYGWWCGVSDYPSGSGCADSVLAQNNVPQDAIDTAIKMELDYSVLGEINGQPASDQTFHNEFKDFINNFNVISDKNSPRSYSELFLITVEIAYETSGVSGEAPQDAGVRAFGISRGHERWQGAAARGDDAEEFYNKYANMTAPTTTVSSGTSGGTSMAVASSGGFVKYSDLTDAQIWDLAEVAMEENGVNMTGFKNELSLMANLAEANGSQPPNGNNLVDYIANGGWFATSGNMNGAHDIGIDSQYIDAARDVLMNGNRTLPTQILEHDCIKCGAGVDHAYNDESHSVDLIDDYSQWQRGVTVLVQASGGLSGSWVFYDWMGGEPGLGDPMGYFADNPPTETVVSNSRDMGNCPDDSSNMGSMPGGDQIAEIAVRMAWPVQAGQGDDAHVGKCKNSSGTWETYSAESYPFSCPDNPRDFYREQLDTWLPGGNALDCGIYVTTVLRYAGAMDSDDHYSLEAYFETQDMWEHLSDYSVGNLRPGDVLFSPGHVFLYVGEYGGSYGTIASASLDERVGQVTDYYNEGITNSAWRYKGYLGGGLTSEQAEKLASNYNNNVGNWDGTVAAEGNYCQDAGCASRYSNCVLFSAFFVEKFAGVSQQGWPNGGEVVGELSGMGFEVSGEPQVLSVFSYPTAAGGHTGVVVRIDGDKVYTVEAGYPSWPGAVVERTKQEFANFNATFAHVGGKVDTNKLMEYIGQ